MIKELTPEKIELLKNEYENADFSKSEGLSPIEIERNIRNLIDNKDPDESFIITRARALKFMLSNMRIDVNKETYFAQKFDLGATYKKQWVTDTFYTGYLWGRREQIRRERNPEESKIGDLLYKLRIANPCSDYGHACLDWKAVMTLGLKGLLDRAKKEEQSKRANNTLSKEQEDFYQAIYISYEAVFGYCDRLIKMAKERGAKEFAECMASIKDHAPETLYEALQLSLLMLDVNEIGIERIRSLGNIDVLFAPFYHNDINCGRLTKQEASELFKYFCLRIYTAKRAANQPLCIGGVHDGKNVVSDMTFAFLSAYKSLKIINPKIHVRICDTNPPELLNVVCEMISNGNSSIVLINDQTVMKGYEKIGIPPYISQNYLPIGCYENVIVGYEDGRICNSWINMAKAIEFSTTGGYDILTGILYKKPLKEATTFTDYCDNVKYYLHDFFKGVQFSVAFEKEWNGDVNPNALYSSTFSDCIENGKDIFCGGMNVRNSSVKCFGIATVVDSLLAIKHLVYDSKRLTLTEFGEILKANWQGHEALRSEILHFDCKYGTGNHEADSIAQDIYDYVAGIVIGADNGYGGVYRLGADSVDNNIAFAVATGATPDGRHNQDPISMNLRPNSGQEKCGITGFIKSVLSIDNSLFIDGAPTDIVLHPSAVKGEKGLAMFIKLVKYFFANGGNTIQGNIVDYKTLKNAQQNPKLYQDLQIRVCGWNEYFVNMSKVMQEDFIARAKENE
jgi:pyruvate-formate lyase